ncbi:hypothetical protein OUZ56_009639 [Daphnia magna]|uniref:THAP-type domain-containing protein n=1 Tax=Daphnia magna TaxID=35525 RepID=A0ABR0AGJ1_9CRUS|nr:hypothetical protein OUZ56_009639 [Daphnia magna]
MSKKILKPKVCIAELRTNRSDSTDKIFISVPAPAEKVRRCDWLTACGLGQNDLSQKSHLYVCEDHFKMEVDCLNLADYKSGCRKKMSMNKNVIPHRFLRQEDSHSTAVVVEEAAKTIASVSKQTNGMFSQVAYGFESSLTKEVPQSAGVVAEDAVKTKASIAKQTDDFFSQATCDVDSSWEKESALTEAFSWPTIIGTSVNKADKAVATVPICLKNVGVNTDICFIYLFFEPSPIVNKLIQYLIWEDFTPVWLAAFQC